LEGDEISTIFSLENVILSMAEPDWFFLVYANYRGLSFCLPYWISLRARYDKSFTVYGPERLAKGKQLIEGSIFSYVSR
jgi:hypothetical protein